MKVKEMLKSCASQLEQKAKDAYEEGDQIAFYRFVDAKVNVMQALAILSVPPGEYDRDDQHETLQGNGVYVP